MFETCIFKSHVAWLEALTMLEALTKLVNNTRNIF